MRAPLYLVEQGSVLSKDGRRLVVAKDGDVLARVPLLQVSQVIVFGNVEITTPAMKLLLDEGVETVFLSLRGRFYGRLVGAQSGHGSLRVAQVLRSRDPDFALATAQAFVRGKLHNMKVFLQRYARRREQPSLAEAAAGVDGLLERVERTRAISSLSGVEGQGTAIYFGAWKELVQAPWDFSKRIRRPPVDPVNVLLSFGYTILSQNVLGAVLTAGLDPYVGFLHQLSYNRPSLALDMMEEFRPLIVDSVVLRCLNNHIVTPEDFTRTGDPKRPIRLAPEGVKRFIRELEHRFTQEFKHPGSGERITYRRLFLLQAYQLARTLPFEGPPQVYRPFLAR